MIREVGLPFVASPGLTTWSASAKHAAYRTSTAIGLLQDREDRIRGRLQYRVEELRAVVPAIGQAAIRSELAALRLVDLQKKLRSHVAAETRAIVAREAVRGCPAAWRRELAWGAASGHEPDDGGRAQAAIECALSRRGALGPGPILAAVASRQRRMCEEREVRRAIRARVAAAAAQWARENLGSEARAIRQRLAELRLADPAAFRRELEAAKEARLQHLESECSRCGGEVASRLEHEAAYLPLQSVALQAFQMSAMARVQSTLSMEVGCVVSMDYGLPSVALGVAALRYAADVLGDRGPFLVVAPATAAREWARELSRLAPMMPTLLYQGRPEVRHELARHVAADTERLVVITTEDLAVGPACELSNVTWGVAVVDEGREPSAQARAAALHAAARWLLSRRRLLVLHHPVRWADLGEVWALLGFAVPGLFEPRGLPFDAWLLHDAAPSAGPPDPEESRLAGDQVSRAMAAIRGLLGPFVVHRSRAEALVQQQEAHLQGYAPPRAAEVVVRCRMSALQAAMYRTICDRAIASLADPVRSEHAHRATLRLETYAPFPVRTPDNPFAQLLHVCNQPAMLLDPAALDLEACVRASGKLDALDQILRKEVAAGRRTLVFSRMSKVMEVLERHVRSRHWQWLRIEGTARAEARARLAEAWNAESSPYVVFLIGTNAAGMQISRFDAVVVFDIDWNPTFDPPGGKAQPQLPVRLYRPMTVASIEEELLQSPSWSTLDSESIRECLADAAAAPVALRLDLLEQLQQKLVDGLPAAEDDTEAPLAEPGPLLNNALASSGEEFEIFQRIDAEDDAKVAAITAAGQPKPSRLLSDLEIIPLFSLPPPPPTATPPPEPPVTPKPPKRSPSKQASADQHTAADSGPPTAKRPKQFVGTVDPSLLAPAPPSPRALTTRQQSKRRKGNRKGPAAGFKPPRQVKPRAEDDDEDEEELHTRCAAVWGVVANEKDEFGRVLSIMFMNLPPRNEFPDYYATIKHPMSLSQVQQKRYESSAAFARDMQLIFSNARQYNREDSQIYADAEALDDTFTRCFEEHFDHPPPLLDDGEAPFQSSEEEEIDREEPSSAESDEDYDGRSKKSARWKRRKHQSESESGIETDDGDD